MLIAIISESKAQELQGQTYSNGVKYNPVKQEDGTYFISLQEAQYLNLDDVVKLEEYVEPVVEEET